MYAGRVFMLIENFILPELKRLLTKWVYWYRLKEKGVYLYRLLGGADDGRFEIMR